MLTVIVLIILAALFIKFGILLILVKLMGTALLAVSAVALGLIGLIAWKWHRNKRKKEDLI